MLDIIEFSVSIVFNDKLFALKVPCIAVVENMCYFDADGKRYYPFGEGSGSQASFNSGSYRSVLLSIKISVFSALLTLSPPPFSQVVQQFGIPHLFDLPIRPTVCYTPSFRTRFSVLYISLVLGECMYIVNSRTEYLKQSDVFGYII